jgi:ribosomal protein S12
LLRTLSCVHQRNLALMPADGNGALRERLPHRLTRSDLTLCGYLSTRSLGLQANCWVLVRAIKFLRLPVLPLVTKGDIPGVQHRTVADRFP